MSEFDFSSLKKKKEKKPDWNKGVSVPEVHSKPIPIKKLKDIPTKLKKSSRAPRTPKKVLEIESLLNNFTKIIKAELEDIKLQNEIKAGQLVDLQATNQMMKQQLDRFIYSEKNLLLAIHRRVNVKQEWKRSRKPKGIKADNLMPRFGEQVTRDEIQADLRNLRDRGILKRNKDGWYNFTQKGFEYLKQFL